MRKTSRFFSFIIVLILALAPLETYSQNENNIIDIPYDWSRDALLSAVENDLLVGNDGYLYPDKNLSRAELATIMNRVFKPVYKADISNYTDVNPMDWFYYELAQAVEMGTFKGFEDKLRPNDDVTREEAFVVLSNALTLKSKGTEKTFLDIDNVSNWAIENIYGLINAGYIDGSNGMINPKANITKAEFAQLLYNIFKMHITVPGTYTEVNDGNVIVNSPNVTLKDLTIKGDLIIADGVGEGEVILDNVHIIGRVFSRTGENSIRIIDNSNTKTDKEDLNPIEDKKPNSNDDSGSTTKPPIKKYKVNYSVIGENGTLTGTIISGDTLKRGRSVVFTAIPSDGYEIKEWKLNGEVVTVIGDALTKTVEGNTNVTVEFKKVKVEPEPEIHIVLYYVVGNGGTIEGSINSGIGVAPNTEVTLRATPVDGFKIKAWKVNDQILIAEDTLTIRINEYTKVSVEFEEIEAIPERYMVRYDVIGENGSIEVTVEDSQYVNDGTKVTFKAIPAEGYEVKEWKENWEVVTMGDTLTRIIKKNTIVTVEFQKIIVKDTTPPEFISMTPKPGDYWRDGVEPVEVKITAKDDNLYRMATDSGWYFYALEDVYNGDTKRRQMDEDVAIFVTYENNTWTFSYQRDHLSKLIFILDFEDYEGNKWSDVVPNREDRDFSISVFNLDKAILNMRLGQVNGLNPEDYTIDSWNDLMNAVNDLPETTQDEVDLKVVAIVNALSFLADTTELKFLLLRVDELNQADYSEFTWGILMDVINEMPQATKWDIDTKIIRINNALDNLADISNINKLKYDVSLLNREDYSEDSWNYLIDILDNYPENIIEQVLYKISKAYPAFKNLVNIVRLKEAKSEASSRGLDTCTKFNTCDKYRDVLINMPEVTQSEVDDKTDAIKALILELDSDNNLESAKMVMEVVSGRVYLNEKWDVFVDAFQNLPEYTREEKDYKALQILMLAARLDLF